tara:strand:- start:255 stop:485 length:231 start_codon:yes stop_codon:yes gene_type:complete
MNYAEVVANNMKKGLTNELRIICEIGRVLREAGTSPIEQSHLMNDHDFIPDVLGCYAENNDGIKWKKPTLGEKQNG